MIHMRNDEHGILIARAAGVVFHPGVDVCISRVSAEDGFLGGFVLTDYTGSMMTNHMAGVGGNWCSSKLLWIIFDYQFNQLGLKKVLAPVSSLNPPALDQVRRAGFKLEHVIADGVPGGDMYLFSISRDQCKWLNLRARFLRTNGLHRGEHAHA